MVLHQFKYGNVWTRWIWCLSQERRCGRLKYSFNLIFKDISAPFFKVFSLDIPSSLIAQDLENYSTSSSRPLKKQVQ